MTPWTGTEIRSCSAIFWISPASTVSTRRSSCRNGREPWSVLTSRKKFSTASVADRWSFPPSALKNLKGGFSHRQEKITERADHGSHSHPCHPVCGRLPGAVHRQLCPLEAGRRLSGGRHFPPARFPRPVRLPPCSSASAIRNLRDIYLHRTSCGTSAPGHADRIQRYRRI